MELIVCASNIEFNALSNNINDKEWLTESIFISNFKLFARIGVGLEESYNSLLSIIKEYNIDKIILVGTCASITDSLKLYDIVSPSVISLYYITSNDLLKDRIILNSNNDIQISSSDNCIQNKNESELLKTFNISMVDMESYSIAKVCKEKNIPLIVIKGICDEPYMNDKSEYDENDWIIQNNTKLVMQKIYEDYLRKEMTK